jgi:hypothetical protein
MVTRAARPLVPWGTVTIQAVAEEGVRIEWSTAEVRPERAGLAFTVRLVPEPDSVWTSEWARIRDRRIDEGRVIEGIPSVPTFGVLRVSGVEEGQEEMLREVLDAMVREANEAVARGREERDEGARVAGEEGRKQEEVAREMTERFRSDGG